MSDTTLNAFVASGTTAERTAFTPSPPTPASGPDPGYVWYDTDTSTLYSWTGAAWQAIGGGVGSGLTLVEQHTASASASLNFTTGITSAYDHYLITFLNLVPATNAVSLNLRMSTDGGSSYDSSTIYSYESIAFRAAASSAQGNTGQTALLVTDAANVPSASTDWGVCGEVRLYSPGSALYKQVEGKIHYINSSGFRFNVVMGGAYESTTAVNAFQVLFSSGNIASGTVRLYGLEK